jgi:hypothetical protein
MTISHPRDRTPRATLICVVAILTAVTTAIVGGALVSKTLCDGQTLTGGDSCGDPLTRPHFALGWSILFSGLAFAVILFVLGLIYREVTIARRYAELASTRGTSSSVA